MLSEKTARIGGQGKAVRYTADGFAVYKNTLMLRLFRFETTAYSANPRGTSRSRRTHRRGRRVCRGRDSSALQAHRAAGVDLWLNLAKQVQTFGKFTVHLYF
jgi:hypothetical protein